MFFHLNPWKSWQVIAFSFMWMLRNSNKKSIWWNFKFKFWSCLATCQTWVNFAKDYQKDSYNKTRCKYVKRSQHDYFTKGLWIFLVLFSLFCMKQFLNEIFWNFLLEIHIVDPIDHMFCVNHCWINMNFSKCVNFARFFISFWKFIII
jgi:hypothetical protein